MAITPEQANGLLPNHKAAADAWEMEIDARIQEVYSRDSSTYISVGAQGHHRKVREEIQRRYEAAGWSVRFTSDQREGDYLTLRPAEGEGER